MRFDIDEARRHHEAVGIYDLLCVTMNSGAERCDSAASDRNIANHTWPATPVDNEPTANQEIPAHTHSSRLGRGERTFYALAPICAPFKSVDACQIGRLSKPNETNALSLALPNICPKIFPPAVLTRALIRPFIPPTPRLAIDSYWRAHPLRADRLARGLAAR